MEVYKTFDIACSHQLKLPYTSKCNQLHGHNYKIEVWLRAPMNADGMVMDFSLIKEICMIYDHQNLNDYFTPPTAEKFVEVVIRKFRLAFKSHNVKPELIRVRVWETATSYAEGECHED